MSEVGLLGDEMPKEGKAFLNPSEEDFAFKFAVSAFRSLMFFIF